MIIQKYDHFCGFLPDKRVTDLSPLKRLPCWHIKRDVNILINGDIYICREDLKRQYPLGNALEGNLQAAWQKGARYYHSHLKGELPDICRNCDEYYTYNF